MESVIDCLGKVLLLATNEQYTGKAIYDHLDSLVIATDEIIDEGIIVNLDPHVIFDRMKMKDSSDPNRKTEQKPNVQPAANTGGAFSSFFGFAKTSLQKTLNLG